MEKIKVSIIIPVYNASKSIRRCINSILNQSYKKFELILINDGSKDDSLKIIKKYEKQYPNIRVIDKENEGVSKTRNLGIKKAKGEYVMFIDNDDYIDKDYVKTLLDVIETTGVDCVYSGFRREDKKGKVLFQKIPKNTEWSKYITITPWAKIFKKSFLIKNDISFLPYKIGEDIYFSLKLINKKADIKIIKYAGYVWFYNDESVSNTIHKGMKKEVDITFLLDKLKNFSKGDIFIRYYLYRLCIWYLFFSGKQAEKEQLINEYNKYQVWLKQNDCIKTLLPWSTKLKGESFRDRSCVFAFKIIDKFHLIKLFANIYCRG